MDNGIEGSEVPTPGPQENRDIKPSGQPEMGQDQLTSLEPSELSLTPSTQSPVQRERSEQLMEAMSSNPRVLEVMEKIASNPELFDRALRIAESPAGELMLHMEGIDAAVLASVLRRAKEGKGELGEVGKTAKNKLEVEKLKKTPGLGALIKKIGIDIEEFSKLEPSQKAKIAARLVSALAIGGFLYYAFGEVQQGLGSMAEIPQRIQELISATVPDLSLVDKSPLIPRVDVTREGFLPSVNVTAPDVAAALKPVFDKLGRGISMAEGRLIGQVGDILTHYIDAAVATAGAGAIALSRNPFKRIDRNSSTVLPVLSKLSKGVGSAIMASEKAARKINNSE